MSYFLAPQEYTWKQALCWGNFISHCKQVAKGNLTHRVVHLLFVVAEFLPVASQIVSIFEKVLVTSLRSSPPAPLTQRKIVMEDIKVDLFEEQKPVQVFENAKEKQGAQQIQNLYRMHQAQLKAKKLREEKPKQPAPKVEKLPEPVKKIDSPPVVQPPREQFNSFSIELASQNGHKENLLIDSSRAVEALLKRAQETVSVNHQSLEIRFDFLLKKNDVEPYIASLKKSFSARHFHFLLTQEGRVGWVLVLQPNPIRVENLGANKTRRTYENGIVEEVAPTLDQNLLGSRVFPDGTKERGEFDRETGKLIRGYAIDVWENVRFPKDYIPTSLIPNSFDLFEWRETELGVCDIEDKLVVIKKVSGYHNANDLSVDSVLLKLARKPVSIRQVLFHKDFARFQQTFLDAVLTADDTGTPRLFGFSAEALADILEWIVVIKKEFNPLEVIDPISRRNLLQHAGHLGSSKVLDVLIHQFPKAFLANGQEVMIAILQREDSSVELSVKIVNEFEKLGGSLDPYHQLYLKVARCEKPDEQFNRDFDSLSFYERRNIYDAAFMHNNPFIFEPSDTLIPPNHYSINLLFLNTSKVPVGQDYLLADQEQLIKPIVDSVKANPESAINIWYDSEMVSAGTLMRSENALSTSLKGTTHGEIQWRDVRNLETVRSNPSVFNETVCFKYREGLLKAITADHVLKNKEVHYCVHVAPGMTPLSGSQIFDKRTVNFLNHYGFVLSKGGDPFGFEYAFQIFNGKHEQMMLSHRKVLIDLNVEWAKNNLYKTSEREIFDGYLGMFAHYLDDCGRFGKVGEDLAEKDPIKRLLMLRWDIRQGMVFKKNFRSQDKPIPSGDVFPSKPVALSL